MEFDDVGATLKGLDAMDAKLFGGSLNIKAVDSKSKESILKTAAVEHDDFDIDSDDLADILNDDVVPSKKTVQKSPIKTNEFPNLKSTRETEQSDNAQFSASTGFNTRESEQAKPLQNITSKDSPAKILKNALKDDISSDDSSLEDFNVGSKGVKNSTFLSGIGKSSTGKKDTKKDLPFAHNETNFLNELNVNELSLAKNSKNHTDIDSLDGLGVKSSTFIIDPGKSSPVKTDPKKNAAKSFKNHTDEDSLLGDQASDRDDEESEEEDNDFLNGLGLGAESQKKKMQSPIKKNSFLDNLSENAPLQFDKSVRASGEKNLRLSKDGDILDSFIPSSSMKGDISSPKKSAIQEPKAISVPRKRRDSLLEKLSFSDIPEQPEAEDTHEKLSTTLSQEKKSTQALKKKDDSPDWLNFFKKVPSEDKAVEPEETKKFETRSAGKEAKGAISNRRRSSSADWLGITEPSSEAKTKRSNNTVASDWLQSSKLDPDDKTNTTDWLERGESKMEKSDLAIDAGAKPSMPGLGQKLETSEMSVANTRPRSRRQRKTDFVDDGGGDAINNLPMSDFGAVKASDPISNLSPIKHSEIQAAVAENVNKQNKIQANSKVESDFVPETVPKLPNRPVIANRTVTAPATNSENIPTSALSVQFSQVPSHQNYIDQNTLDSLQLTLKHTTLQNEQLIKSSEAMKTIYEEKFKSAEDLYKEKLRKSEEYLELQTKRLKEEYDEKFKRLEQQLSDVDKEKKNSEASFQQKLDDLMKDHRKEVLRLKELHSESVSAMKQDHEDAILRLKKLKDQEVEAISSSQVYARSLQNLTDQLEDRASQLAALQSRIEEKNRGAMKEKQAYLDNKEKDLKALQNRLNRQLEEGDEERTRLQQLVLRLETRLQKYTMEGEEDRWDVQQAKARLTVQQRHLEEEQKLQYAQIEREKEKLRLSQDSLLHEQKTVLLQLAQERQQFTQEKIEMESLSRRVREEEARLNVKKLKEESTFETQRRFLQQEEDKLHLERSQVKQESYQSEREKENLQREKQKLKEDKEKFNEFQLATKRQAEEVEEMAKSATAEREQGRTAHAAARKIEAEHHCRLQQFTQQMQSLMDKERQILLEKEKLSEERLQIESKKDSMTCHRCKLKIGIPASYLQPVVNPAQVTYPAVSQVSSSPYQHQPQGDPSLFVWYITGQREQEFLQEELSFLHSLKDGKPSKD